MPPCKLRGLLADVAARAAGHRLRGRWRRGGAARGRGDSTCAAAISASARACSTAMRMSAARCCSAWKLPIGTPNCLRVARCSQVSSVSFPSRRPPRRRAPPGPGPSPIRPVPGPGRARRPRRRRRRRRRRSGSRRRAGRRWSDSRRSRRRRPWRRPGTGQRLGRRLPVRSAVTISQSALSPCGTTALAPSSRQPPPLRSARVRTSCRS